MFKLHSSVLSHQPVPRYFMRAVSSGIECQYSKPGTVVGFDIRVNNAWIGFELSDMMY